MSKKDAPFWGLVFVIVSVTVAAFLMDEMIDLRREEVARARHAYATSSEAPADEAAPLTAEEEAQLAAVMACAAPRREPLTGKEMLSVRMCGGGHRIDARLSFLAADRVPMTEADIRIDARSGDGFHTRWLPLQFQAFSLQRYDGRRWNLTGDDIVEFVRRDVALLFASRFPRTPCIVLFEGRMPEGFPGDFRSVSGRIDDGCAEEP
ncbi:hypothetical protein EPO33_00350 [Patescibacteria group bacterium]|nr:MAG: hypothetical protein EPO33_00350 [Patescibacteria group bacterium]